MGKRQPLAAEMDALRAAYAALNRGDVAGMVAIFDPEIVWIEPAGYSDGTYRGLEVVRALFEKSRATWAEGGCDLEELIPAGDKVVAIIHVHVRVKGHTEWAQGRHASVYTFRNGKAIEQRIIDDIQQALAWAGVKSA
jgi:ketosteroid isomerase-like protein